MKRRVVVTGLGIVCPVGLGVEESWQNILAGKSGIAPVTGFDTEHIPVRFGGAVKSFDISKYISPKEAKKMDPFIHYGLAAGVQAIEDAGLEVTEENAERIGISIGSGIGGLPGIEKGITALHEGGPRRVSPFFVPSNIINMIAGHLSMKYGILGPNYGIVTACASGTHSIGDAARIVERGDADVMIAGGAEMATCPIGLSGFAAARALSTRNDDPERASRPWDKDRDGFVLADGAGVIALEEYEHAKARGANIYAELVGYAMNGDAYHLTAPAPDGRGARRCMELALADGSIDPSEVDYINAHGTSTPAGDIAETQAIKSALGQHASEVAVSSTKSMIGHLLGAAGGVEAVFAILSIRDQVAPPTINLDNPDPECDLDYVPHTAREMKVEVALSNSFGFGGTNGTLVFRKI